MHCPSMAATIRWPQWPNPQQYFWQTFSEGDWALSSQRFLGVCSALHVGCSAILRTPAGGKGIEHHILYLTWQQCRAEKLLSGPKGPEGHGLRCEGSPRRLLIFPTRYLNSDIVLELIQTQIMCLLKDRCWAVQHFTVYNISQVSYPSVLQGNVCINPCMNHGCSSHTSRCGESKSTHIITYHIACQRSQWDLWAGEGRWNQLGSIKKATPGGSRGFYLTSS